MALYILALCSYLTDTSCYDVQAEVKDGPMLELSRAFVYSVQIFYKSWNI
jgi:hypothetical protein